jgi:hypothetical protein
MGRVQRIRLVLKKANNFNPKSVAGMLLWLDASTGITLVSGQVDVWADQSGNGNNATAPSSVLRPDYSATGFKGKAAIDKTSTPNLTSVKVGLRLASQLSLGDFTIIAVRQKTGAAANRSVYLTRDNSAGSFYMGVSPDGSGVDSINGANVSAFSLGNAYATSNQYNIGITCTRRAGTVAKQQLNNNAELTYNSAATTTLLLQNLLYYTSNGSATYDFTGFFAELLVFNNSISDADKNLIMKYLNDKYSIY